MSFVISADEVNVCRLTGKINADFDKKKIKLLIRKNHPEKCVVKLHAVLSTIDNCCVVTEVLDTGVSEYNRV